VVAVLAALASLRLVSGPSQGAAIVLLAGGLFLAVVGLVIDSGLGSMSSDVVSGALLILAGVLGSPAAERRRSRRRRSW
jgi:hypothetical protein